MTWVFLNVADVETLHKQSIQRFGGSPGLRDRGLLESAVARAEMTAHYEPDASIPIIAASLGYGLIKNHAFIDGNKRVGLQGVVAFLRLNGFLLVATIEDQVSIVQRAAASEITEAEWTAWVIRSARSA